MGYHNEHNGRNIPQKCFCHFGLPYDEYLNFINTHNDTIEHAMTQRSADQKQCPKKGGCCVLEYSLSKGLRKMNSTTSCPVIAVNGRLLIIARVLV